MRELLKGAMIAGDTTLILKLLPKISKALLLRFDTLGSSVAYWFALKGELEGLRWLNENCNEALTQKNATGATPFIAAVIAGKTEVVRFFEENGIDTFASPVHAAAFYNLLPETVSIDEALEEDTWAVLPVTYAAAAGNEEALKILIEATPQEKLPVSFLISMTLENNYHQMLIDQLIPLSGLDTFIEYIGESHAFIQDNMQNGKEYLLQKMDRNTVNPGKKLKALIQKFNEKDKEDEAIETLLFQAVILGCEHVVADMLDDYLKDNLPARRKVLEEIIELGSVASRKNKKNPSLEIVMRQVSPELNESPEWVAKVMSAHIIKKNIDVVYGILEQLTEESRRIALRARLNDGAPEDYDTLLHHAAMMRFHHAASILLVYGADKNIKNSKGLTVYDLEKIGKIPKNFIKAASSEYLCKMVRSERKICGFRKKLNVDGGLSEEDKKEFHLAVCALTEVYTSDKNFSVNILLDELFNILSCKAMPQINLKTSRFLLDCILGVLDESGVMFPYKYFLSAARMAFLQGQYKQALRLLMIIQTTNNKCHAKFAFYNSLVAPHLFSQISLILQIGSGHEGDDAIVNAFKYTLNKVNELIFPGIQGLINFPPSEAVIGNPGEMLSLIDECAEKTKGIFMTSAARVYERNKKGKISGQSGGDFREVMFSTLDLWEFLYQWIKALDSQNTKCQLSSVQRIKVTDKNVAEHLKSKSMLLIKIKLMEMLLTAYTAIRLDVQDLGIETSSENDVRKSLNDLRIVNDELERKLDDFNFGQTEARKKRGAKRKSSQPDTKVLRPYVTGKIKNESNKPVSEELPSLSQVIAMGPQPAPEEYDLGGWSIKNNRTSSKPKLKPITTSKAARRRQRRRNNHTIKQITNNSHPPLPGKNETIELPTNPQIPVSKRWQDRIPQEIYEFFNQFKPNELFLTGGAILRAKFRKPFADFDFVTTLSPDELKTKYPEARIKGKGKNQTLQIKAGQYDVDVAPLRSDSGLKLKNRLKQDSCGRDFTVNAFYWCPGGNLRDFYSGLKDLKDGIIKVVPAKDQPFKLLANPLQVFRLIKLQTRYGFELSDYLKNGLQDPAVQSQINNVLFQLDRDRLLKEVKSLCSEFSVTKTRELLNNYNLLDHLSKRSEIFKLLQDAPYMSSALGAAGLFRKPPSPSAGNKNQRPTHTHQRVNGI